MADRNIEKKKRAHRRRRRVVWVIGFNDIIPLSLEPLLDEIYHVEIVICDKNPALAQTDYPSDFNAINVLHWPVDSPYCPVSAS